MGLKTISPKAKDSHGITPKEDEEKKKKVYLSRKEKEEYLKEKEETKNKKLKVENIKRSAYFRKKDIPNPAADTFFGNGIKLHKLRVSTVARYFNTMSLVKIFIFEPFYVTLQLFPSFQIFILAAIQLSYTVMLGKAGIKDKVFSSWLIFISTFIGECALSLFMVIGIIFQMGGGVNKFKDGSKNSMQFIAIGVMTLSCLLSMIELIVSVIISVVSYIKDRKIRKYEEEARKLKEEDGLVEQKEGSDGAERDAIIGDKNDEPSNMNLRDNQEEPDKRPLFSSLSKSKVHPRRVKLPLLQPSLKNNNDQSDL